MRTKGTKWKWAAALGMTALAWRWYACGPSEEQSPTEATIHVELAQGVTAAKWEPVLDDLKVVENEPLFARSAAALEHDRAEAAALSGETMPDLSAWRRVTVRGTRKAIDKALARMRDQTDIREAFVAPTLELPYMPSAAAMTDVCPIKTPPYDDKQGYLKPAPGGIDVAAAWKKPGGKGEQVWFADIEGGWNTKHEDLPGDRISIIGKPMKARDWEMHGTAVLGEVVSRTNELGMVGIAPNVPKVVTSSISGRSAATAIDLAAAELRPGDVLLIELHAIGPRGRFMPVEFWDDTFEVIKLATSRGIIVIEAAGNGAEDLDHEAYKGKLDRKKRDSGAIMVGAGAPALKGWTDRSRLDFSNYGGRVDVQGWGRMVATLDYGDLQGCDATDRKYTNAFGGTSSASPIVAGAAIVVQSIVKADKRKPISPLKMREILAETGSPQVDGPHGPKTQHIGPRPDLARAIKRARKVDAPDAPEPSDTNDGPDVLDTLE